MHGPLILYPDFAMFLLVTVVLLRMRRMRFDAVRAGSLPLSHFRDFPEGREPEALRVIERHFRNLFEMPVLFYVATLMAYLTQQLSLWLLGLAWAYVALRCAHSAVHLGSNRVLLRLRIFVASNLVLAAIWITLLAGLLTMQG